LELETRELSAFLLARVRELSPDLRAAVVLRDIEGLSNAEVAEVLGLSIAATKSRIHRGRMRLREDVIRWRRGRSRIEPDDRGGSTE